MAPAEEGASGSTDHGRDRSKEGDSLELSRKGVALSRHTSDERPEAAAEAGGGAVTDERVDRRAQGTASGAIGFGEEGEAEAEASSVAGSTDEVTQPEVSNSEAPGAIIDTVRLTPEEQLEVTELRQRDREVRAHEQAHASAGGAQAGAPHYEYEQGPDGGRYAVGGEVSIQFGKGGTPEETIRSASQARRAALAPAEPSAQDLKVAAEASKLIQEARAEQQVEESTEQPSVGFEGDPEVSRAIDSYRDVGQSVHDATHDGASSLLG